MRSFDEYAALAEQVGAAAVVTGRRMGRRALKFRDFGKVATTFCDLREGRAVRVAARQSSKQRAGEMYPGIPDQKSQQMRAYREMPDRELFDGAALCRSCAGERDYEPIEP